MEYSLLQPFSSQDAILSNVIIVGTVIMAITLIVGSLWLIYSSLDYKYGLSHSLSRRVENLYVKINYGTKQNPREFKTGYLLSLGLNGATMVVREAGDLQKGAFVQLYFDGPDADSHGEGVAAKITKFKCIPNNPTSYQLNLRFAKANKGACTVVEKSIMKFSTRWNR